MCTRRLYASTMGILVVILLVAVSGPAWAQTTLVPTGSTWKYLDDGSDQGTAWRMPGFADGGWSDGPAQLGYGDGDEATVVSFGSNSSYKHITTYFRHAFTVTDPSLYANLLVRLLRDDGAVVYLNGVELHRSNMTAGPFDFETVASGTVGGDDEDTFYETYVSAGSLLPGPNLLAVEIHQRSRTSSDISLDLELLGVAEILNPVRKAPHLVPTGNNSQMRIEWQLITADTCLLEWGPDTLYGMGNVDTHEYGSDHQHGHIVSGLAPATRYHYRVTAEDDVFTGSFLTAPPPHETEARFLAYGDTRTYPDTHNQVAAAILAAVNRTPEFQSLLIAVGDLINDGNLESDWDNQFFSLSHPNIQKLLADIPYAACMGNHEGTGVLFKKYLPYPFVDARYWSFDYGPAHFVVLDQYVNYNVGSPQYNWLQNDLASTDRWWRFIYLHEPGWSAGDGHGNDLVVQTDIQPLCEQYGVPIVFGGHNHYYARAEVNGVQHITTGGGGAPLHTPNLGYPNVVAGASAHHYCEVVMSGSSLFFAAISTTGDTLDQFTVSLPVTAVNPDPPGPRASGLTLHAAAPNPFASATTMSFSLDRPSRVLLTVFDINGRKVRTLVDADLGLGRHDYPWDGRDDAGRLLGAGLYFYRLRSDDDVQSKKVMRLK